MLPCMPDEPRTPARRLPTTTARPAARRGWTSTGASTSAGCRSRAAGQRRSSRRGRPPLVFIHGLSGCWQNWLENIPVFARDHRVIAIDLPGFGDSPMPAEKISIPGYGALRRRAARRSSASSAAAVVGQLDGRLHRRRARDPVPRPRRAARARQRRGPDDRAPARRAHAGASCGALENAPGRLRRRGSATRSDALVAAPARAAAAHRHRRRPPRPPARRRSWPSRSAARASPASSTRSTR